MDENQMTRAKTDKITVVGSINPAGVTEHCVEVQEDTR